MPIIDDIITLVLINGTSDMLTSTIVLNNVSELALATPEDNDYLLTLGYYSINDGGGQFYQYDISSTDTVDSGFVLNGPDGSGRYIAVNQDIANVKAFGARGDDATDDYNAISAAVAAATGAGATVFFPRATYRVGTEVVLTGVETDCMPGTVVKPYLSSGTSGEQTLDRVFDVASNARLHNIIVDMQGEECSGRTGRGEGIRLTGASGTFQEVFNCTVRNSYYGGEAHSFTMAGNGTCSIQNCKGYDSGYTLIGGQARNMIVDNFYGAYTRAQLGGGSETTRRLFSIGGNACESFQLTNTVIYSDQTLHHNGLVDFLPGTTSSRRIIIDGLYFDNKDHTESSSTNMFKFENCGTVSLMNIFSNQDITDGPDKSVRYSCDQLYIDNSRLVGGLAGAADKVIVDNVEFTRGSSQYFMEDAEGTVMTKFSNSSWSGFTRFANNSPSDSENGRIIVEDGTWISNSTATVYLFNNAAGGFNRVGMVQLRNFKVTRESGEFGAGTANVVTSNNQLRRTCCAGYDDHTILFDWDLNRHYDWKSGTAGTSSTTASNGLIEPDTIPGNNAFSGLSGMLGDRIVNMNPANGYPLEWIYNTSDEWEVSRTQIVETTVANLPSPTGNENQWYYTTDGAAGSPVMVFSDGSDWLRSDTLTAAATS